MENGGDPLDWHPPTIDEAHSEVPAPLKHSFKQLLRWYWTDWVAIIVLFGIILLSESSDRSTQRYITPDDLITVYGYPLQKENTVPSWAVPVISYLVPGFAMPIYNLITGRRLSRVEMHNAILGLCLAVTLSASITNVAKIAVARPRPNFVARCWDGETPVFDERGFPACTNPDEHIVSEGRKSFPSGHTSWTTAGLGFLTWWLMGKMRVFDGNGHALRLAVASSPLLGATFIGFSRVTDYWHHPTDVIFGWLLGVTTSLLVYRQHYPSFLDPVRAQYAYVLAHKGEKHFLEPVPPRPDADLPTDLHRGTGLSGLPSGLSQGLSNGNSRQMLPV